MRSAISAAASKQSASSRDKRRRANHVVSALSIQTRAIRCEIEAIVDFAIANDTAKLPIRAALRDALERLERKEFRGVADIQALRRREISSGDGDAA
jgi:hypothetical protein